MGRERLAEIHGVAESARFLGQVANEERDTWLERAHVFAMPSRVPGGGLGGEGFGIVYMEASWRGLPVVAGNVGGAVDAVVDGETGLLVDANDPVAVSDAVTRLLVDTELGRRLGERGSERAREFAWPLITRRVEDVLLDLVNSR
jgi:phosphatidylinositol alpha-1,6-mannosyltransferase